MPVNIEQFVDYSVLTELQGDDIHVQAGDGPGAWHWYINADAARGDETLFDRRSARRFFGQTCGMTEDTRDGVVDKIDFAVHLPKATKKADAKATGQQEAAPPTSGDAPPPNAE